MTIERFLEFQHRLQSEILRLEFRRKGPDPETGRITERQFAELLLTYADYSPKKRSAVLKRVKRKYKQTEEQVVYAKCGSGWARWTPLCTYFPLCFRHFRASRWRTTCRSSIC